MPLGSRSKIWQYYNRVVKQVKKENADRKVELEDKKQSILERQVWGYCKFEKYVIECFAATDRPPLRSPTISMLNIQLKLQSC